LNKLGRTQTTDFLPFAGYFFAPPGEKITCKGGIRSSTV
jgi:hypothetical protein